MTLTPQPVRAYAAWHPEKGPNLQTIAVNEEQCEFLAARIMGPQRHACSIIPVSIVPVQPVKE